jgi:hypothetical protein
MMQPGQLLPHLAGGLRMALVNEHCKDRRGAVRGAIWRYLAIHRLRWPEGKIQAPPGAFNTPSLGWERDREVVVELIERFASASPDKLGAVHPTFGRMRPRDWDVLQYRRSNKRLQPSATHW